MTVPDWATIQAALRAGADAASRAHLRADPDWRRALSVQAAIEADVAAYFEERAAIREYEGGFRRAEAERLAWADTLEAMKPEPTAEPAPPPLPKPAPKTVKPTRKAKR